MVKIQWYPGHMEKARRQMAERLKAVDLIIELRDARIPEASTNPMLNALAGGKPRLIVLAKSDMSDPVQNEKWVRHMKKDNVSCMTADLLNDPHCGRKIIREALKLMKPMREKQAARGIRPRAVRAMACGIPNVGKSTMINRIAGRNTVKAADKPGVTKSLTWIHADDQLELLDTPGVLWPKFEDEKTGSLLAALGSINDDILNRKMVAMDAVREIQNLYPGLLEEMFDAEGCNPNGMLKAIAEKRNLRREDDLPDTNRAAEMFLNDLRKGKLGRLSLEHCHEENNQEMSE